VFVTNNTVEAETDTKSKEAEQIKCNAPIAYALKHWVEKKYDKPKIIFFYEQDAPGHALDVGVIDRPSPKHVAKMTAGIIEDMRKEGLEYEK
jgi:hypothetical protein